MKKLLFILMFLFSIMVQAQILNYADLSVGRPQGPFESYISKTGDTYSVGDTLVIGNPSGTNGRFVFIYDLDVTGSMFYPNSGISHTNSVIKKIRVAGSKRAGWKVSLQTKGLTGLSNHFFNLEDAIESGEVVSKGFSSDAALAKLKNEKDKLDLGIITQEEFDKKKAELIKYIK